MQPYWDGSRWVYPPMPMTPHVARTSTELDSIRQQLDSLQRTISNRPLASSVMQPEQNLSTPSFIPVSTEQQAWDYQIDQWRLMAGDKFYFFNEKDCEIYCRWYDAEKPEMMREIYRKEKREEPTIEKASGLDIVALASTLDDRVYGIEERVKTLDYKLDKIVELMSKPSKRSIKEPEVVE